VTIDQALSHATNALPSDTARLDAELLLAQIINKTRSHLYAWPEQPLNSDQYKHFLEAINLRAAGEPLAYLTGHREFWSLDLQVSSEVLIPRPETELLVELALKRLPSTACKVAELGTGSGAIALALASERAEWDITATDISEAALNIARKNASALQLDALNFAVGRWYQGLPGKNYQLIISNPPYVSDQDPHLNEGDARFEPKKALMGGRDGLRDIRHLISNAVEFLIPEGWLMLEHGYDQAEPVRQLFLQAGFASIETYHDLAKQPRVTIGCK
jgi:release factor glutamine methyltransferase